MTHPDTLLEQENMGRAVTVRPDQVPGAWLREGLTIYALEPCGFRRGAEQFRNRWHVHVQRGPDTPVDELEAVARKMAAADDLLKACRKAEEWLSGWESASHLHRSHSGRHSQGNWSPDPMTPEIGSLRIIEREDHPLSREWTWRYSVERLLPGGRFLFWKSEPEWRPVYTWKTYKDCADYVETQGRKFRVVDQ